MSELGDLEVEQLGGVAVISLRGEHDLATAPAVERQLEALLGGGASVVVDLSQATFVDSSIVRALYGADPAMTDRDRRMALAAPPGTPPRRLLDLVALAGIVPTFDSRDAAVAHVRD